MKRRKRMNPRSPRKTRMYEADAFWSQAVLARDGHRCQLCGAPADDAHHIIHRARMSVRYDLGNGISLCRRCHSMDGNAHEKHTLHLGIVEWLGGEQAYDALRNQARVPGKVDYEAVIAEMEKLQPDKYGRVENIDTSGSADPWDFES